MILYYIILLYYYILLLLYIIYYIILYSSFFCSIPIFSSPIYPHPLFLSHPLIPLPHPNISSKNNLTPHVLSEWMVEVCRFEVCVLVYVSCWCILYTILLLYYYTYTILYLILYSSLLSFSPSSSSSLPSFPSQSSSPHLLII